MFGYYGHISLFFFVYLKVQHVTFKINFYKVGLSLCLFASYRPPFLAPHSEIDSHAATVRTKAHSDEALCEVRNVGEFWAKFFCRVPNLPPISTDETARYAVTFFSFVGFPTAASKRATGIFNEPVHAVRPFTCRSLASKQEKMCAAIP